VTATIRKRLKTELPSPAALLDPEVERLLEGSRQRVILPLSGRERCGELVAATTFLVAAVALALFVPAGREADSFLYVSAVLAYAIASRVTFDVGASRTDCTQLVLIPMLLVLTPTYVPLLVAAGYLMGELPDYVFGRRHPDRMLVSLGNAWYAVGPALVLVWAGPPEAALGHWPLYLAALAAQFLFDVAATTPREWFELGVPPRLQVHGAAWTFAVDTLLTPIGLLAALASVGQPYAFLLVIPLVLLFAVFAGERELVWTTPWNSATPTAGPPWSWPSWWKATMSTRAFTAARSCHFPCRSPSGLAWMPNGEGMSSSERCFTMSARWRCPTKSSTSLAR
jgi:hypothetical protein